jgi:transposase
LFATPGRDGATVKAFAEDLKAHGGYPEAVGSVSCDMSVAFISGVGEHLSNADITFDRFHIMKSSAKPSTPCAATRPRTALCCCARPAGCG